MFAALLMSCAALLFACALLWLRGRRVRRHTRHLPGFPPLPLIGNIHQIMGDNHHIFNKVCEMSRMMDEANAPFVGWLGPCPFIMVSNPEDVKAVTNTFIEKPFYYNFARDYVGNGLVTAPAAIWKHSIKKLGGTFTGSIVEGYQEVFNAQAQRLVQKLRAEVGKEPFDAMKKYLAITALETICQTALGIPRISDSVVTTEYYAAFVRVFELLVKRIRNLFMHLDFIYRLSPDYRELLKCVAVLHNASRTIMATRRKEREDLKAKGVNYSLENEKTRFKSFLDILLDLQDVDPMITDEQIRSEVDTIIVGGQETVATTMFMSLLMMGCKPDIQEKLYAEIKEIFGDSKRPVGKEDLARMKYCDAVVNETLRMYPAIPIVARVADRDLQLKSCLVPEGTFCAINIYGSGRSKHIWGPDADEYRPERWLTEDNMPMTFNLLAFSYGKRACIGRRYALPIIKTILVHCVREYKFKSEAENLKLRLDVGLKAQSGHLMTISLRE